MSIEEIKILAIQASVVLAILLPLVRAGLRKMNCVSPDFTQKNITHDISNGITLPYFFLLIIAPFVGDSNSLIADNQIMVVAGFYGIVMVINDLVDHRNPSSRTRSTDKQDDSN